MTARGRLMDFAFVCLSAAGILVGALWLFPYFELVAPVAAIITLMFAVSLVDGIRFAIRHRSRLAVLRRTPAQHQDMKDSRAA